MMLVTDTITIQELENMSHHMFQKLVKAVVDIEENIMVVDGELHADQSYFYLIEVLIKKIYGESTCTPNILALKTL